MTGRMIKSAALIGALIAFGPGTRPRRGRAAEERNDALHNAFPVRAESDGRHSGRRQGRRTRSLGTY